MHLNAIIGATAKAWTTARGESAEQKHQQAHHQMRVFLTAMCQRLQSPMPAVGAREAANLLWSSAQLGLNPGALVPGMTDSLALQFMANVDVAIGQEFANVLVACAKLQLSPCQGELVKAVCVRLAIVDMSDFNCQAVANILHSLVALPAVAPSIEVLDALCKRFKVLLNSRQTYELLDAQSIANTMWALSKLKHAPSDELVMSMVHTKDDTFTTQTWLHSTVAFSMLRRQEYNAYNCAQNNHAVSPNELKVDSKGSNSSR